LGADLASLGIEIAAVVDRRPSSAAAGSAWPVYPSSAVIRAEGNKHLKAVVVALLCEGGVSNPTGQEIACDVLCLAGNLIPANELLLQATPWLPDGHGPRVFAAGAADGCLALSEQVEQGRARGAAAAARVRGREAPLPLGGRGTAPSLPAPSAAGKAFVCLCEDVTAQDVDRAAAEGFDRVETLKRYSTALTGPCEGKTCAATVAAACARAAGKTLEEIGTTTSR